MDKGINQYLTSVDYCYPVQSGKEYFTTACVLSESKDMKLGDSFYIPIVKLTAARVAKGVRPDDPLTAHDVEKYTGTLPSDINVVQTIDEGQKYIDSITVVTAQSSIPDAQQPIMIGTEQINPDASTNTNTLAGSLAVQIKTNSTAKIVSNDVIKITLSLTNSAGNKCTVIMAVTLDGDFEYKAAAGYIQNYYNYAQKFQIVPDLNNIPYFQGGKQLVWQTYFEKHLVTIKEHLNIYYSNPSSNAGTVLTISQYMFQVPKAGLDYNKSFCKFSTEIGSCIDKLAKAYDEAAEKTATADLDQINTFIASVIQNTQDCQKQIGTFGGYMKKDERYLETFASFLEVYCKFLTDLDYAVAQLEVKFDSIDKDKLLEAVYEIVVKLSREVDNFFLAFLLATFPRPIANWATDEIIKLVNNEFVKIRNTIYTLREDITEKTGENGRSAIEDYQLFASNAELVCDSFQNFKDSWNKLLTSSDQFNTTLTRLKSSIGSRNYSDAKQKLADLNTQWTAKMMNTFNVMSLL